MSYVVRPISDRTPFKGRHRRALFSAPWPHTEALLLSEVHKLLGLHLVIEADVRETDIRLDGRLRASARPDTPAVRVAFTARLHNIGDLTYATDVFSTWQDNVRAIALGLEALRKVDRYGITQHGEQYTGWKAIEATPAGIGTQAACALLAAAAWPNERVENRAEWAPKLAFDRELAKSTWRQARARSHPDRNNGDRTLWDQVEQAANVLGLAS